MDTKFIDNARDRYLDDAYWYERFLTQKRTTL